MKIIYNHTLARNLKGFSLFATSFAYISILTGVFQTFGLGMNLAGAAFSWGWILVLIGNSFIALNFAELAAHYPLSGGIYQYAKYIASPFVGWLTGWMFLICNVITLAAVPLALQNTLTTVSPVFHFIGQVSNSQDIVVNAVFLGVILLVISTLLTSFASELLVKINNTIVMIEIVFLLLLLLFLFFYGKHDLSDIVFDTSNKGDVFSKQYLIHFLSAMSVTACYTLYGYDTAGTFGEETVDPNKRSSWSILLALWSAGIFAWLLTVFALKAAPDLSAIELYSNAGLAHIIKTIDNNSWISRIFCLAAGLAIASCTFSVHSNLTRLIFAIARDNLLPFSNRLTYISSRFKSIIFSSILSGVLAIFFLMAQIIYAESFEMIIALAASFANFSYLIVIASLLYARLKGWPQQRSKTFYLDRKFALFVNIVALLWGIFVVINLNLPRNSIESNPIKLYSGAIFTLFIVFIGVAFWFFRRNRVAWPSRV